MELSVKEVSCWSIAKWFAPIDVSFEVFREIVFASLDYFYWLVWIVWVKRRN